MRPGRIDAGGRQLSDGAYDSGAEADGGSREAGAPREQGEWGCDRGESTQEADNSAMDLTIAVRRPSGVTDEEATPRRAVSREAGPRTVVYAGLIRLPIPLRLKWPVR